MPRLFLFTILLFLAPTVRAQNANMTHRWLYLQTNFLRDEKVSHAQELLKRAKEAGYNGMVVTDVKFDFLDRMPPRYFQNVAAVKQTARELGIGVYPVVCSVGYQGGALSQNPQLAEALPVQNAPFIARNGILEAVSETTLHNGDFERAQGDKFAAWHSQDGPGKSTFSDRTEKHGGTASIRMESFAAGNEASNARIVQRLETRPHQWLHLSVWLKTQDFETPNNARALVLGEGGKQLAWVRWNIARTQGWTRYDTTFNTGESAQIRLYLGVWGGRGGQIWWDDARVESAGLFNLVRRPGAPFQVQGEDAALYEEGRDFEPVKDEKTGAIPYLGNFDNWHEPPTVRLTPNSRIKNGQTVHLGFYAVQKADEGSVAPCLTEPETFEVMREQIRRVVALWQPQGLFLGLDEIRQLGSCAACQKSGLTAAQILSNAAQECLTMARQANSKGDVWIWSDMFDPHHNARDNYYLVNGSLVDSWQGLDKEVGIMNWNFGARQKSLDFFSKRGHSQIICGFYDSGTGQIKSWLEAAKDVPDINGAMYTTWNNDYSQLETFAQSAWGN